MIKKLVFFIYVDSSIKGSPIYRIHIENLRKCVSVFDEAVFVFSLKDMSSENKEFAQEIVLQLLKMGYYRNTTIRFEENTKYREAKCFKEEVVDKLEEDRGKAVFFGHAKGVSNVYNESVTKWICSMYYFGALKTDDMENWFTDERRLFYGYPYAYVGETTKRVAPKYPRYEYYYMGTLYWLNINRILLHINETDSRYKTLGDRYYAEEFPGENFPSIRSAAYEDRATNDETNPYEGFDLILKETLSDEDIQKFEEYYNDIMKEVN